MACCLRARRDRAPELGSQAASPGARAACRVPAASAQGAAARSRQGYRGVMRRLPSGECEDRDPTGLRRRTRQPDPGCSRAGRRLGRSDSLQQHQGQGPKGHSPRRFFGSLHALRSARARDGGGDERHRRTWGVGPLWWNLSDLLRLRPPRDPAVGLHGGRRHLCHDPRFDRARRGWSDPSAGRASGGAAGDTRSLCLPPRRCGRDCGVLVFGAAPARRAVAPRLDPPVAAAAAPRSGLGELLSAGCL